jgi:hypothetical protein
MATRPSFCSPLRRRFHGSTDAMEALAVSGLRTVLFLSPPKPDFLQQKFPDLRCMV